MSGYQFQRLEVNEKLALEMFEDNEYKRAQIPSIASKKDIVPIYRIGDFIDISKGPCIANTNQIGKCSITAVHPFVVENKQFYRIQGVGLPKGFRVSCWYLVK